MFQNNDRQVAAVAYAAYAAYLSSINRPAPAWSDLAESTQNDMIARAQTHREGFYRNVSTLDVAGGLSHDDAQAELIFAAVVRAFGHHEDWVRMGAARAREWKPAPASQELPPSGEEQFSTRPNGGPQPQRLDQANEQADADLARVNEGVGSSEETFSAPKRSKR